MELRQLEIFLAVLEASSVTRAGHRVYLTPGAVSLQLQSLARELGTDLFVRSGRVLVPTPAALRLADHARAVLRSVRQIEQEFATDPMTDIHPFHFATGATALIYRLGRPLRLLRKRFPQAHIEITVSATEEMAAGLHDRKFDLALISLPYEDPNLECIPIYEEELLVLKPSVKAVSGWRVGTISVEELSDAQFLLYPPRSNMRQIIDRFLAGLGVAPHVIMEADDTEAIKKLVESGFGYSILPDSALRVQGRFYDVFRLKGNPLSRTQAFAMAKTAHPRALTMAIAEFLRAALTTR